MLGSRSDARPEAHRRQVVTRHRRAGIARIGRAAAKVLEVRAVADRHVRTRGIYATVGGHIVIASAAVSKTIVEPPSNVCRGSHWHGIGRETVRIVRRAGVPGIDRSCCTANVIEDLLVAPLVNSCLRVPYLAAQLIEADLDKRGRVLKCRRDIRVSGVRRIRIGPQLSAVAFCKSGLNFTCN